jgi:hypothetical protein
VRRDETTALLGLFWQDQKNFWRGAAAGGRNLGHWRDSLLLGAGVLYILGYVSWALYGWSNGIGFIPVLDTQYFAAGVVPALLFGLFWMVLRFLRVVNAWTKGSPTQNQMIVTRMLVIVAVILLSMAFVLDLFHPRGPLWLFAFGGLSLYLAAVVARKRGLRFYQVVAIFVVRVYAFLIPLLWLWYVDRAMPNLPPEFGGAEPRCVFLDVDSAQLSSETRGQFLPKETDLSGNVRRTTSLSLIFDGSEYFFVTARPGRPSSKNPVYRVRKDAVKGIFPCPLPASLPATDSPPA